MAWGKTAGFSLRIMTSQKILNLLRFIVIVIVCWHRVITAFFFHHGIQWQQFLRETSIYLRASDRLIAGYFSQSGRNLASSHSAALFLKDVQNFLRQ